MNPRRLDPRAALGAVHLTVRDLERSADFYVNRLGMTLARRDREVARLGAGGADLLALWGDVTAPRVPGKLALPSTRSSPSG